MRRFFYIRMFTLILFISCSSEKIKLACVGDSITFGSGIKGRDSLAYPQQLQKKLGKKYDVRNFGVSGATMLKNGNKPYWKQSEFKKAKSFNPDIVIILLGTNDSKPINWNVYKTEFEKNYNEMIDNFLNLKSIPTIYIGLPPPALKNQWNIQKEVIENEIIKTLKRIAFEKNVETIDFYNLFKDKPDLIPDYVHPNTAGASLMANKVLETVKTHHKKHKK